jgi:hypothetical protein
MKIYSSNKFPYSVTLAKVDHKLKKHLVYQVIRSREEEIVYQSQIVADDDSACKWLFQQNRG